MAEIPQKHVAVAGGAGYIGSHTVLELLQKDYKVRYCSKSHVSYFLRMFDCLWNWFCG